MRAVLAVGVALALSGCAGDVLGVVGLLYDGLALGADAFKRYPAESVRPPATVDLASAHPK